MVPRDSKPDGETITTAVCVEMRPQTYLGAQAGRGEEVHGEGWPAGREGNTCVNNSLVVGVVVAQDLFKALEIGQAAQWKLAGSSIENRRPAPSTLSSIRDQAISLSFLKIR